MWYILFFFGIFENKPFKNILFYNILSEKQDIEILMKPYAKYFTKATSALPAVIAIIIMLFLPACDNKKPIKIGFVGGLTGKYYDLGVPARNGVILAVEEINKKGGIKGQKIQLIIKNDMQDAKVLQKAVAELIEEGVTAIVGPVTSGMSLIALPQINEKKVIMISPTATSSKLSGRDDYFIKINSNVTVFSEPIAEYASNKIGLKSLAVIYDLNNRAYTEEFLRTFKSRLEKKNSLVREFSYDSSENISYTDLSRKLLASNPDGILIIANTFDTAMLCQNIRKLNSRVPLFSSPWAMTKDIIPLGGKSVEGLIFGHTYSPNIEVPLFKDFRKNYEMRFGREPDFASVKGYDASNLLFSVIADTPNIKNLRETIIKKQRFKGIAGDFEIDMYGDIAEKGHIIIINDGKLTKLE